MAAPSGTEGRENDSLPTVCRLDVFRDGRESRVEAQNRAHGQKSEDIVGRGLWEPFLGQLLLSHGPHLSSGGRKKTSFSYSIWFGVWSLSTWYVPVRLKLYGKLIIVLKPGFLMKTGMLVSGLCAILFSFLDYAPPGTPFIALSIVIRGVDALGASAFLTASYTTIGCELPDVIGRAMVTQAQCRGQIQAGTDNDYQKSLIGCHVSLSLLSSPAY
ncbi:MFS-type transporter SLC18B1 [Caerostris extrusa]|uniref:MFS-type transporter SLC18B1 n=1 Tax=Caerostris extrusa TaxID=172846 RepID=A0AAV4Q4A6_CAEEX|nr:MFS-type transporter SLC18B1 [Caerostris extrusa]